jgi:proton-dependent oligopeptide transporter, POT family
MDSKTDLIERIEAQGKLFGHPKGLYLLFFTEMWERFSYYGMRGILMLYMTKLWVENGLNIPSEDASLIYGFFGGFVYFTPLFGGLIADRLLGQRLSITIGGITMFAGQLVLFLMNSHLGLGIGLFLLVIGNGFFKPNISTIVGQLYREGDPKKDAAFSIFYMGINLGALLAPLVIGVLAEDMFAVKGVDENGKQIILSYGFKYGFLVAAIGMALGQITFNLLAKKYLLELGTKPTKLSKEEKQVAKETPAAPVDPAMRKIERQRLAVIFILTFFVIFFWAGFEQAGSSLTLYTDKYIDRVVGGWEIPTTFFQAFNPILIVAFAPIFAWLWTTKVFAKMSTPVKMSLGMILLGVGFLFMLMATFEVKTTGTGSSEVVQQKAALIWLLLTYFLHTIGELCLSPVGLSMVTKMAPVRLVSLMMGVWMLSSFFANIIGGFISKYTQVLGAFTIFSSIALFVIVLGLVLLIISRRISKLMNGVV